LLKYIGTHTIHKNVGSPFTTLELVDGASITAKIVIGCDGVHSVVAQWIGLEAAKPSGRVAFRGMVTFSEGHHRIEEKMVIIVGKGVREGFIPCTDKQIYWFITQEITTTRCGHILRSRNPQIYSLWK
jgi:2-polyprenyl-6-methoxyphenol hydroxylase-like FAD-dependent oxidoreductase